MNKNSRLLKKVNASVTRALVGRLVNVQVYRQTASLLAALTFVPDKALATATSVNVLHHTLESSAKALREMKA